MIGLGADKKGKSCGPIFAVLPRKKPYILFLIDLCFCLLIVVVVFIFNFFCFLVGARCSETSPNTTKLGNGRRGVDGVFFLLSLFLFLSLFSFWFSR